MKKIIILVCSCVLLLHMTGCSHETQEQRIRVFDTKRINDEHVDETEYFYSTKRGIFVYDLEKGTTNRIISTGEDEYIESYAMSGDYIYFTVKEGRQYSLKQLEYPTGKIRELYQDVDIATLVVNVRDGYMFIGDTNNLVLMCPENGDFKEDAIELDDLFADTSAFQERSDGTQAVNYEGFSIIRAYSEFTDSYKINCILDSNFEKVLYRGNNAMIAANETLVTFKHEFGDPYFTYQYGDGEETEITCLSRNRYKYSDIYKDRLYYENGKITALISVSTYPRGPLPTEDMPQSSRRKDILFQLDPVSGENSIIYDTRNHSKRIIGYKDNIVYLYEKEKIYAEDLHDHTKTYICDLPEEDSYTFDWVGNTLIVTKYISGLEGSEVVLQCNVK